jgi:hypothetical protein
MKNPAFYRLVGLATGLALSAALVVSGCNTQSRPDLGRAIWTPRDFFGVNAPTLRDYTAPERRASLNALATSMSRAGVAWARVTFDQSVEERTPGNSNWLVPDAVVGALARQGVRAQALFYGTASWAASSGEFATCGLHAAPTDFGGWSGFVGAAVARYGRNGSFWRERPEIKPLPIETWEIGNEENTHLFWCPQANPEKYAQLYSASRSAALQADPQALIIVGGLAPSFDGAGPGDVSAPLFLRRMVEYEPSLAHEIPAVAVHPYAATAELVFQAIKRFREAMRQARLGDTPMIANELGWYTSGPPGSQFATQGARADRIRSVVLEAQHTNCDLVALGIHSWVTAQVNPVNPEDWYGLADPTTGAPNPSGREYGAAIHDAQGSAAGRTGGELAQLCD